jgi:hypothetical protein
MIKADFERCDGSEGGWLGEENGLENLSMSFRLGAAELHASRDPRFRELVGLGPPSLFEARKPETFHPPFP